MIKRSTLAITVAEAQFISAMVTLPHSLATAGIVKAAHANRIEDEIILRILISLLIVKFTMNHLVKTLIYYTK